jgi:hypothetical protein
MHHGGGVGFYKCANVLALQALEITPWHSPLVGQARWLFAAAKDRLLLHAGRRQVFGIQGVQHAEVGGGWWVQGGLDERADDALRGRWGAPTAAQRGPRLLHLETEAATHASVDARCW